MDGIVPEAGAGRSSGAVAEAEARSQSQAKADALRCGGCAVLRAELAAVYGELDRAAVVALSERNRADEAEAILARHTARCHLPLSLPVGSAAAARLGIASGGGGGPYLNGGIVESRGGIGVSVGAAGGVGYGSRLPGVAGGLLFEAGAAAAGGERSSPAASHWSGSPASDRHPTLALAYLDRREAMNSMDAVLQMPGRRPVVAATALSSRPPTENAAYRRVFWGAPAPDLPTLLHPEGMAATARAAAAEPSPMPVTSSSRKGLDAGANSSNKVKADVHHGQTTAARARAGTAHISRGVDTNGASAAATVCDQKSHTEEERTTLNGDPGGKKEFSEYDEKKVGDVSRDDRLSYPRLEKSGSLSFMNSSDSGVKNKYRPHDDAATLAADRRTAAPVPPNEDDPGLGSRRSAMVLMLTPEEKNPPPAKESAIERISVKKRKVEHCSDGKGGGIVDSSGAEREVSSTTKNIGSTTVSLPPGSLKAAPASAARSNNSDSVFHPGPSGHDPSPKVDNTGGVPAPPSLKRDNRNRGDPRMNRAVSAKLKDSSLTLLDALLEGGFYFPTHPSAAAIAGQGGEHTKGGRVGVVGRGHGINDKHILDREGVSLYQRKNQLNRRLRRSKAEQVQKWNKKRGPKPRKGAIPGANSMSAGAEDVDEDLAAEEKLAVGADAKEEGSKDDGSSVGGSLSPDLSKGAIPA